MRTRNVQDAQLDFLVSAMHHGSFMTTADILAWMKQQNEEVVSNIMQIPLTELKGWSYRDDRIILWWNHHGYFDGTFDEKYTVQR